MVNKIEKKCFMSWFSISRWFCFLGDIWQRMVTFLVITIGCLEETASGRWVEARDAAKHPTKHRTATTTEKYSGPKMCIGLTQRDSSFMEHDLITWKIHFCRPSQLLLMQEKEPTLHLICQAVYICRYLWSTQWCSYEMAEGLGTTPPLETGKLGNGRLKDVSNGEETSWLPSSCLFSQPLLFRYTYPI